MGIEIRQVANDAEREQVFRFRYRIYVERMGRPQKHADHERRQIEEPLDATARIFAAFDADGQVVGTVRYNFAGDADDFYREFYGMERRKPHYPGWLMFAANSFTVLAPKPFCAVVKGLLRPYPFSFEK